MTQLRSNKAQVPTNADTWSLTGDLAILADSLEVIVPVADRTEADAVAAARAAVGWPVTDARPLFVWNSTTKTIEVKDTAGWRGAGLRIRSQHFVASAFAVSGGSVAWDVGPLVNQAGDAINGGFATQGGANGFINIAETGWYSVLSVCMPNGSPGNVLMSLIRNGSQIIYETGGNGTNWGQTVSIPRFYFTAGDTLLWRITFQVARTATTDVWLHKLDN
jgi:hypothetical protein